VGGQDRIDLKGVVVGRTVVVLGAGVGGLSITDALGKYLPDGDRVVLVDRSDRQCLGLSLLWVLRGWRQPDQVQTSLDAISRPGLEFVRGEVEAILPGERRVRVSGREIMYDALVVALGAEAALDAVPGVAEAIAPGAPGGEFFSLNGAATLSESFRLFEGGRLCVVVTSLPFRCPAAPYEAALLLGDLLQERELRAKTTIDAFTPEPFPMPVAGSKVGQALVGLLAEHGIGFHPQSELESIDADGRELRFKSGQREAYDFVVVIPPHRPPAPLAGLRLSQAGWVPVQPRTLASPAEGVWAIGDATALVLPNGKNLPKAGVFAQSEAETAARAVARHLGHDAPEPWFAGAGWCYVEVGGGLAAQGRGNFLAEPDPEVELLPPAAVHHAAKEAEEAAWWDHWRVRA
jgi:sulfide:quinone oxidoreductase